MAQQGDLLAQLEELADAVRQHERADAEVEQATDDLIALLGAKLAQADTGRRQLRQIKASLADLKQRIERLA